MIARSRSVLRRLATLVAGVSAGVLVVVGLGACSGDGGADRAPSNGEVRALLARHAAGVLRHDRADFLAGIDSHGRAAAFHSDQAAEYDNLVKVPLGRWSYSLGPPVTVADVQAAARKRYGASARIVRLELHYALRGVDTVPVEHDLWWTFVRRDGQVLAVADDALAQDGGVSWAGPWDFGPLAVVSGRSSVVLGRADQVSTLSAIAAGVDAAIPAVSAVWGDGWTRRVAVIVPPTSAALSAALGASNSPSGDIAALAVSAGSDPLTGRPLEQRLVIDPSPYAELSAVGRRITLTHEITHLASAAATSEASPRWLVEGFAEYVANLHSGQPVAVAASELRAQLRSGRLPSALPSDAAVDAASTAPSAYEQGWLACRLIAARVGQAGLVRFYRAVGASPDDSDTAVAAGLRSVLHERLATFTAQWRAYLTAQLG